MIARLLLCMLLLPVLAGGCVELGFIPQDGVSDATDGGSGSDGADGDGSSPDPEVPVVRLRVSNPSPLVGEEVLFTCEVVDGSSVGATFAFQSADVRLSVNTQRGTASYIVDQSDVGAELTVTCTAANAAGTSEPSNRQTIIVMQ